MHLQCGRIDFLPHLPRWSRCEDTEENGLIPCQEIVLTRHGLVVWFKSVIPELRTLRQEPVLHNEFEVNLGHIGRHPHHTHTHREGCGVGVRTKSLMTSISIFCSLQEGPADRRPESRSRSHQQTGSVWLFFLDKLPLFLRQGFMYSRLDSNLFCS